MVVSFFACFLACLLKITGAAQRFLFSVRDSGCHGNARSPAPVKVSAPPEMWEARTLRSARANGTRQPPPPPPPATGRLGGEEEEDLFVFNDTIEGLGMSGVVCECVYYCRTYYKAVCRGVLINNNDGTVCVFITAVPITKLFARGGGGGMEEMCYERLRAESDVN